MADGPVVTRPLNRADKRSHIERINGRAIRPVPHPVPDQLVKGLIALSEAKVDDEPAVDLKVNAEADLPPAVIALDDDPA